MKIQSRYEFNEKTIDDIVNALRSGKYVITDFKISENDSVTYDDKTKRMEYRNRLAVSGYIDTSDGTVDFSFEG